MASLTNRRNLFPLYEDASLLSERPDDLSIVGVDFSDKAGPGILKGVHLRQVTVVDKENADGCANCDGKTEQNDEYERAQISFKVPLHDGHYTPCQFIYGISASIHLRRAVFPLYNSFRRYL